jgi:hypothetical protein
MEEKRFAGSRAAGPCMDTTFFSSFGATHGFTAAAWTFREEKQNRPLPPKMFSNQRLLL